MAWLRSLFQRRRAVTASATIVRAPYQHVWWVLNAEDTRNCCPDCETLAANSPYDPPWVTGGNTLDATPGDGHTRCLADCTCFLSYGPPPLRVIGPPQFRTPRERAYYLLNTAQRTFVHHHGLNMTETGPEQQIVTVACADGTILRADEDNDQYFTVEEGTVMLWEDIAETSHDGWTTYHTWVPVQEWSGLDVLWIFPEGIYELMAQCWPQVPEYDEAAERELNDERRARNAAKGARDLEEYQRRRAERLAKRP